MNARPSHARSGFTLIEMMITLGIFVMLAGAVFEIFSATLEGVGSLQDNQDREDQAEALGAWLKQSFLALPADGGIMSLHRDGAPFEVADVIWGVRNQMQALDLHLQPNGLYTLRLASYSPPSSQPPLNVPGGQALVFPVGVFAGQVQSDDPSLEWRPLIRDLKTADWRFRSPNMPDWQKTASGVSGQTVLVELQFQMAGSLAAVTDDFWIPPLQSPINPAPAPAAAVTTNP